MEFAFRAQEPNRDDVEVFLYIDRVSAGRLVLTLEVWEHLAPMLISGGMFYQDGEATIKVEQLSSVPAFLEGG